MRTTIFLLAAAAVLAACSEETTAPLANKSALAADNTPTIQGVGVPQGARTRLTIKEVESAWSSFGGSGNLNGLPNGGPLTATCPLGMEAVGGGFEVMGNAGDLTVYQSRLDAAPGTWKIGVAETGGPNSSANVRATVVCVQ